MKRKQYKTIIFGGPIIGRCTGCDRQIFPDMGKWCPRCRSIYKPDAEGKVEKHIPYPTNHARTWY